jgi:hypothetical protein
LNIGLNPLWKNPAGPPILDRPQLAGDDQHANLAFPIVEQLCNLGHVDQRGVKIISVSEFAIMINILAWILSSPSRAKQR